MKRPENLFNTANEIGTSIAKAHRPPRNSPPFIAFPINRFQVLAVIVVLFLT